MSTKQRWTPRHLRQRLAELGCTYARHCGSHEVWRLPDGSSLPPFVGNHANDIITTKGIERALADRGIVL